MARADRIGGQHHPDIPLLPAPLIGRQAEIALAGDLLRAGARLLTLTGPPGVGKTSLALALGAQHAARHAHGAALIDLAPVRDAELVTATIADALGAGGRRQPIGRLIALLRRRDLLLVLDNFEQVVGAAPAFADLLAACPDLTILVTSRVPLRVRWEYELPVPPLQLPSSDGPRTADALAEIASVRLFVERARAVNPGFALTDENAPVVARICARLDGLPLAIELAAARARLLPPAAMLQQLAGSSGRGRAGPGGGALGLLTEGPRDLPARQQTLRDAIAWSHVPLDDAERRLFRRLAIFAGGCTYEAAEMVCAGSVGTIGSLVEKSLIHQVLLADETPRLRMLETIREYALEQLQGSDEVDELQRRHAAYYLELAERAEPELFGPDQELWLQRLDQERDNLRAVERTATRLGDSETVLRLEAALLRYRSFRDDAAEARARVDDVLALARAMPPQPASVRALHSAGVMARFLGDYGASRALLEESLQIGRRIDDRRGVVNALHDLARLAYFQDRFEDARALGEESLALASELGDQLAVAGALFVLGFVSFKEADPGSARAAYDRALAMYRQLGDQRGIGDTLYVIGLCFHVEGALDTARELFERCLAIDRALGHRRGVAMTLQSLGNVLMVLGDLPRARSLFREGLIAAHETGDRRRLAYLLSAASGLATTMGEPERAVRMDAAGRAFVDALGARMPSATRALYDEQLRPAMDALGASRAAAAAAAGRAMTLDQAVDEALAWLGDAAGRPSTPRTEADTGSLGEAAPRLPQVIAAPTTGGSAGATRAGGHALTARERDVAALIARGLTNRQIAEALVVTDGTAANYVQRVMSRLGFHNRAQVAAWAVEHGLHTDRT